MSSASEMLLGVVFVTMAVFFVALCGLAIFVVWRAVDRERARSRTALDLAARHGFMVDVREKAPPPQGFDLFRVGRSQRVRNQVWRHGQLDSVFDHRYQTGGDNNQVRRHTCALIHLPFVAPHTTIGPGGFWTGIGTRLGVRNVEVESTRFNDMYRVTSDDERFAVTMLDGHAIDWFLHHDPHTPSAVRFEFHGPWMLCITHRLSIDRHVGFLDWAQSIPTQLPDVLTSLYPDGEVVR